MDARQCKYCSAQVPGCSSPTCDDTCNNSPCDLWYGCGICEWCCKNRIDIVMWRSGPIGRWLARRTLRRISAVLALD